MNETVPSTMPTNAVLPRFASAKRSGPNGMAARGRAALAALLALMLFCLTPAYAQRRRRPAPPPAAAQVKSEPKETQDDLKKEIEELRAGQQAIQKELGEIKKLLLARQTA